MRARGCGERSVAPHSMSSAHMSDEYANSPLTFGMPSGRRTDTPTPLRTSVIVQVSLIVPSRPTSASASASTLNACRRYAALPRTSSIGDAAAATSSPKRAAASSVSEPIDPANASASRARIGVGPADPMHVPTRPSPRSSANEHTAITIALRVPTFANCCGPPADGIHTAAISSSVASVLRFGPTMNSSTGTRREPRTDASSTSAPPAYSGGSASPAGEEDPRFPPIVPRLRICGEPTVRDAIASPGSAVAELVDHARVGDARADPDPPVLRAPSAKARPRA